MRNLTSRLGALLSLTGLAFAAVLAGTPSAAQAAPAAGRGTQPSAAEWAGEPASPTAAGRPRLTLGGAKSTAATTAASPARELWYTHWYPSPVCSGDVCSIDSTGDLPRFYLSGQNFNAGSVYVGIFRRDGSPILSTTVTAKVWSGFVNYSWGWKANRIDCAAIGATVTDNAFLQAKDLTNNLWSNRIFVTTDCSIL